MGKHTHDRNNMGSEFIPPGKADLGENGSYDLPHSYQNSGWVIVLIKKADMLWVKASAHKSRSISTPSIKLKLAGLSQQI